MRRLLQLRCRASDSLVSSSASEDEKVKTGNDDVSNERVVRRGDLGHVHSQSINARERRADARGEVMCIKQNCMLIMKATSTAAASVVRGSARLRITTGTVCCLSSTASASMLTRNPSLS